MLAKRDAAGLGLDRLAPRRAHRKDRRLRAD